MKLWKVLVEGVNIPLASMMKSILEQNGIQVLTRPSKLFDSVIFGQGGTVDLLVLEDKFEEARSLIEEAQKSGEEDTVV